MNELEQRVIRYVRNSYNFLSVFLCLCFTPWKTNQLLQRRNSFTMPPRTFLLLSAIPFSIICQAVNVKAPNFNAFFTYFVNNAIKSFSWQSSLFALVPVMGIPITNGYLLAWLIALFSKGLNRGEIRAWLWYTTGAQYIMVSFCIFAACLYFVSDFWHLGIGPDPRPKNLQIIGVILLAILMLIACWTILIPLPNAFFWAWKNYRKRWHIIGILTLTLGIFVLISTFLAFLSCKGIESLVNYTASSSSQTN